MKRHFTTIAILAACFLTLGLYSCTKEPTGDDPEEKPGTGDEIEFPELTLSDTLINAGEDGGVFEVAYTLSHTLEGGVIEVVDTVSWVEAVDNGSAVTLTVDANPVKEAREAVISVEYRLESLFVSGNIRISQDALSYDYKLDASYATCEYYGDMFGQAGGPHNYYLMVSDLGWDVGDSKVYKFDIFLSAPESGEVALEEGTYPLGESGRTDPMTFTPEYSMYSVNNATATENVSVLFSEGELVVARDGEDYVLDAVLTDANGETHHMTYTGPIDFKNYYEPAPDVSSVLTDDFTADLSAANLQASYDGDIHGYGTYIWYIMIYNDGWTGDSFIIELCSPYDDFSSGIPDGDYAISPSGDSFTAIQGYPSYPIESGSWLYYYDEQAACNLISPLYSGVISVTNNPDGTVTMEIQCMDDNLDDPHKITGTWTGTVVYYNNTDMGTSSPRASRR